LADRTGIGEGMRRGELSTSTVPRVYVVFENLLGILPDSRTKALEAIARKRRKWKQAVDYYQINRPTSQGIRDLYGRHDLKVNVITFIDPGFVDPIQEKLDSKNLFFGGVYYFTMESLLDDLTYDPSIKAVYDPDPSHALTYGSRGKYCTTQDLDLMKLI
jgi:hypothetical protein